MLRAALTEEVAGPGGPFVVRAEPASGTGRLATALLGTTLLGRRDGAWTVQVRRRPDDPAGAVVQEVRVAGRAGVEAVVTELVAAVHAGRPPFGPRRAPTSGS